MAKKIAAMQPYLFPYLGYFQLIAAADAFVIGDDLQYVKESWINRNRIIVNRQERLVTFPLKKSGHLSLINEKTFADNFSDEMDWLLLQLRNTYRKARAFDQVYPLLEHIIKNKECNLAKYAGYATAQICNYLEVKTPLHFSSKLGVDQCTDKQDRVLKTVKKLDGTIYINPIGGLRLYDSANFKKHGIELWFHKMDDVRYSQFGDKFFPALSIIDVLMFNCQAQARSMLTSCQLKSQELIESENSGIGGSKISVGEIAY